MKNSTEDRIYKAALQVFANKGFEASIVKDILKEAEVSRRTFYKYFNSKEDLLSKFKEENVYKDSTVLAVVNKYYPEYYEQPAKEKLNIIFEKVYSHLIDPVINSLAYQAFFSPNLSKNIGFDYFRAHQKNIEIYAEIFKDLNYKDPDHLAKLCSTFFQGYILEKHIENVQGLNLGLDKTLIEFKKLIECSPKNNS